MRYSEFVAGKLRPFLPSGTQVEESSVNAILFPFQSAIVRWAARLGRCAIFADCGLGKSFMQIEWARLVGRRALIFAPLTVAEQTIREAAKLGVEIVYVHDASEIPAEGIAITNYERVERFVGVEVDALVLDESSILKSIDGKTRTILISEFQHVPFRLACTATPAPNDIAEIANHCAFLGIKSREEMLATFFVHDDDGWRLKGHANEAFYRWLASWSVYLRKPSDIGYSDDGYDLPALHVDQSTVRCDIVPDGMLFATHVADGIVGRSRIRRETLDARVKKAMEVILESWTEKPDVDTRESGTPRTERASWQSKRQNAAPVTQRQSAPEGELSTSSIGKRSCDEEPSSEHRTLDRENDITARDCMASHQSKSGPSTWPRTSHAGSVESNCPLVDEASTSIIATSQAPSEACSVQTATGASDCSKTTRIACAPLRSTSKEQWVVWCGLNDEQNAIARLLGDDCVSIDGSVKTSDKLRMLKRWQAGEVAVLVSKIAICGYGLNLQNCHNMLFLGLSDSFEDYYQGIRRCWRFGQTEDVRVVIVTSDAEDGIVSNVRRKEEEAKTMGDQIIANVSDIEKANLHGVDARTLEEAVRGETVGNGWRMINGDCVEAMRDKIDADSIHLSVYSPPFANLYVYSDSARDLGNSSSFEEFFEHFRFAVAELLRVTIPGRLTCAHVAQVPAMLSRDGYIGIKDFRGECIRTYSEAGWVFHREVCIDKDPQAQSIRTNSKALTFTQMKKDRSWSGPALADYILIFRKPGDNPVPIRGNVDNEEWIQWARPIWYGIRETETLNVLAARSDKDERHICPLQLGVIERVVRMWSNPGETVLSPFAGIGSEGYKSILTGRKFVGIELKEQYYRVACRNLAAAEVEVEQADLFEQPTTFARVLPDSAMRGMPKTDWTGREIAL